ncbi:WAT1-related protein [Salix suchowensis]|nr:WAT1-related protein [Salix suchowensis]
MAWNRKNQTVEDLVIVVGLVMVQFVYAGNSVLLSYLMSIGLNPLTIVIFSTSATFLILSPIAVHFERSKWPKEFRLKLLIQMVLISFGGVTLFQSLYLKGIKLTSPAMATAMPNLAPGLIFIIAWTFRLEKVKLSCVYSKVKIVGTILCVVGALVMSLMSSTESAKESKSSKSIPPGDIGFDTNRIIGCLYLISAVFVLSINVVLQATTLSDFPAPISLCAITSLIGVIITAIVELVQSHKVDVGWPLMRLGTLICYSVLGGAVGGACVSFNGWAMKKRGPVLVAVFNPIGTVISLCWDVPHVHWSVLVLWAKGKEGFRDGDHLESEFDPQKRLLA